MVADPDCMFCTKIAKRECVPVARNVVRFPPLNPVTPGHMLFVTTRHVINAAADPWGAGAAFATAADYAHREGEAFNLITSGGKPATQTIFHLHVHYVPRREGDGLTLPWTGQR